MGMLLGHIADNGNGDCKVAPLVTVAPYEKLRRNDLHQKPNSVSCLLPISYRRYIFGMFVCWRARIRGRTGWRSAAFRWLGVGVTVTVTVTIRVRGGSVGQVRVRVRVRVRIRTNVIITFLLYASISFVCATIFVCFSPNIWIVHSEWNALLFGSWFSLQMPPRKQKNEARKQE